MTNVFIAALSSNDNRLRTLKEHCIGIEKEFGNHSLTRKSRLYRTPKSLNDSRSQRRLSILFFNIISPLRRVLCGPREGAKAPIPLKIKFHG